MLSYNALSYFASFHTAVLRTLVLGLLITPLLSPSSAAADKILTEKLRSLVRGIEARHNKSLRLAVMVSELGRTDMPVFAHNHTEKRKPASVVKLVTSLAALRVLGPQYRFPTEVFVDKLPNERDVSLNPSAGLREDASETWSVGNLYVRGYGDPTMVDERLWELARTIKRYGIDEVQDLLVDDSLFVDPPGARGQRPYQAGASALALNHNCYAVHLAPSGTGLPAFVSVTPGAAYSLKNRVLTRRGKRRSVIVNQSTPSTGFNPALKMKKQGKFLLLPDRELTIDVKGSFGVQAEPRTDYFTVPYPPSFFANVLRHFLEKEGVKVRGKLLVGETPALVKKLLVFESKTLAEILSDLNHYSNNFVAMQLQYALGQDADTGYFRKEIGLTKISQILEELGYPAESFALYDASGLDRRSRLTAEQLVQVLAAAYRDFSVAPELISSLSRYGNSGTLKKRDALSKKGESSALRSELKSLKRRAAGVWGKTGTLNSVSTLAGYLELKSGKRAAFAILVSGIDKSSAVRIEDSIVEVLIGSPV